MKKIILIVGIAVIAFFLGRISVSPSLGQQIEYGYFTSVTSATSSIVAAVTSTAIYSGGSAVANVEVCNTQSNSAYLYLVNGPTATTTGMKVVRGIWLDGIGNTTSTVFACRSFTNFKGDIRGIASVTTTVGVNYSR